jgi:hypothetical protein
LYGYGKQCLVHRKTITAKRYGAIGAAKVNPRILSQWFANPGPDRSLNLIATRPSESTID